ncbi:J domain-containing protein [Stenotrophomonas maltophilia]|uniref:J domain-containing protein n=1 Tax=Stenotrophomonas maltophilia TaxID=40324 RepID=UPI000C15371C|nr:DnaJ domain-containing protein [Stenotrophomonas maltophilia]
MLEKDYYEVLGIRPSASIDEIDLAYKGRRSQYHPDRYASSDSETLAWATEKMKELNAAYAILKDRSERARFDQQRGKQSARPAASPPPIPEPEERSPLLDFLQRYVPDNEFFQKIHVAPNIPQKKLGGALESYGRGLSPRNVIALIDDTVFGSAKEGVLITEQELRFKAIFESPCSVQVEKIGSIEAYKSKITVNGQEFGKLNVPDSDEVHQFFDFFNAFCQQRHADAPRETKHKRPASAGTGHQALTLLEKGYYKSFEQNIDRRIRTTQGAEQAVLQLASRLLPISLSLADWIESESGVPRELRSLWMSDAIRFELLIYSTAAAEHLIRANIPDGRDYADEIAAATATTLLIECIIEVSGFSEIRGLHKMETIQQELRKSGFFNEFMRRWGRYKLLISEKDASGLIDEFEHSIRSPALMELYPVTAFGNEFLGFMHEATDRYLPTNAIPGFLDDIDDDIESALLEWIA